MNKGGEGEKMGSESFNVRRPASKKNLNSRIHPTASNSDKKRPKKSLSILVDVLQMIQDIIPGTISSKCI